MRETDINTSHPYKVLIERGILGSCGQLIRKYCKAAEKAETAVIITDDNVAALYGGRTAASLEEEGFSTLIYTIPN